MQRIHRDTQHATKRWLCKAQRSSRFQNDIDDILQGFKHQNKKQNQANNDILSDDKDKFDGYKSNDSWFTKPSDSPNSIESHESFWDEQIDALQDDPDCIALADFEDDTHEQLRQEINGKWTRRFVQEQNQKC